MTANITVRQCPLRQAQIPRACQECDHATSQVNKPFLVTQCNKLLLESGCPLKKEPSVFNSALSYKRTTNFFFFENPATFHSV